VATGTGTLQEVWGSVQGLVSYCGCHLDDFQNLAPLSLSKVRVPATPNYFLPEPGSLGS
jgi:hypothetical protein